MCEGPLQVKFTPSTLGFCFFFLFAYCLLDENKNKMLQVLWLAYHFPVISSDEISPSPPYHPLHHLTSAQSASGNFPGAGSWPTTSWVLQVQTSPSLSLSLSLFICKYSYPLCFLTPIPEDTDFRGSSKSYLQPFLWAGH